MATSKKFSELPAASSVGNGDLFAIAHEDALAETGYVSQKLTAAQAGQKVNGDTEYPTGLPSFPANGQNPFAALEKLNADIDSLYPVNTASGSIANFTTSLAKPLTELSSTIVAQQAGSGTPTPNNQRAISGWDNINIYHEGDNFIDTSTLALRDVDANHNQRASYAPFLLSAGTYALHVTFSGSASQIYVQNANDYTVIANNNKDFTFTLNTATTVMVRTTYSTTSVAQSAISSIALRQRIDTHTIALGQTVYGGVLDAKSGTGSVTYCYDVFDGSSDESWQLVGNDTNSFSFRIALSNAIKSYNNGGNGYYNWAIYGNAYQSGKVICRGAVNNDGTTFYVIVAKDLNLGITDLTTWKTYLSNNNLQAVNKLATPIEITGLTGANFTTFAGEQNIFADCGDISVSFKQGIQEYIDAKIAETQALIL